VPTSSVAAPAPKGPRAIVSTLSTNLLYKLVTGLGLCRPAVTRNVRKALDKVIGVTKDGKTKDAWFDEATGKRSVQAARSACEGCPVRAHCLELALRQEKTVADVHGVRGGLSVSERRTIVRARELVTSVMGSAR
jgi:hypothetical protein